MQPSPHPDPLPGGEGTGPAPMGSDRPQEGPPRTAGHPPIELIPLAPAEITADALRRLAHPTRRYWLLVLALAALTAVGLVGLGVRLAGGFVDRAAWGYYATVFMCLMSAAQPVPLVAWLTRFGKGQWAAPFRRVADPFALV